MGARTDFWLFVHELTLCLEGEGVSADEQQANVLDSLDSMPPMARQEIIRQLNLLAGELSALSHEIKVRERVRSL